MKKFYTLLIITLVFSGNLFALRFSLTNYGSKAFYLSIKRPPKLVTTSSFMGNCDFAIIGIKDMIFDKVNNTLSELRFKDQILINDSKTINKLHRDKCNIMVRNLVQSKIDCTENCFCGSENNLSMDLRCLKCSDNYGRMMSAPVVKVITMNNVDKILSSVTNSDLSKMKNRNGYLLKDYKEIFFFEDGNSPDIIRFKQDN